MTLRPIKGLGLAADSNRQSAHSSFCVIVPAFNEELLVGRCIESVIAAGVGATHIYVIDDASTDATAQIARATGVNLLSDGRKRGKLGGISEALRHFSLADRYEYLAILDADSHVASDYFSEVLV